MPEAMGSDLEALRTKMCKISGGSRSGQIIFLPHNHKLTPSRDSMEALDDALRTNDKTKSLEVPRSPVHSLRGLSLRKLLEGLEVLVEQEGRAGADLLGVCHDGQLREVLGVHVDLALLAARQLEAH